VIATLEELDETALVEILTKPKNALIKQFETLFSMDKVQLQFDEDAIKAVAKEALRRRTGARGLRAVIEQNMLDVMFEIPSNSNVKACRVTKEVIEGKSRPELIYSDPTPVKKPEEDTDDKADIA
jgi:ATP-dependent Clp protease ATP-binding subunit ClpX